MNWFRKGADGKFLWPGFGENMRVLKWIVDRCRGRVPAYETPVGWMPEPEDIDIAGLADYDPADLAEALSLNLEEWKREVLLQDELFFRLYSDLPKELIFQRELLISRFNFCCSGGLGPSQAGVQARRWIFEQTGQPRVTPCSPNSSPRSPARGRASWRVELARA